jgi:hypothetical protein
MHIDLNDDETMMLRDLLEERVTQLDKQINAADSLRFKDVLRDEEHRLERILGALNRSPAANPSEWPARDSATDEEKD